MHTKSLIVGIVIGVAIATAIMFIFGDQILGSMADTTQHVGKTMQEAGKAMKKQGNRLK